MLPSWEGSVSQQVVMNDDGVQSGTETQLTSAPLPSSLSGKYYAVEDMLTTDPSEKFGKITLQEHYDRIAVEGQEYDPYTTM
jgi:hypothetical protein